MSINPQDSIPYDDAGNSFWDIGGYKPTVKRVTDGHQLCSDLMALVKERSDLEAKYADSLKRWSRTWANTIGKGPEYGTTEAAWTGMFQEADSLSTLHQGIRDKLMNEVYSKVKQWQKENYTKPAIGLLKQTKEMDDLFTKAQKPWAKKYKAVQSTKDEFHKACRQLRTAEINERNQQTDTSIPEDLKRKNIQKIEEGEIRRDNTRKKYETALKDITDYNARYMEDMTEVYNKCQDMEKKRQEFCKETLFNIQECVNLADTPAYSDIYADFYRTVEMANSDQDLKWWSNIHGVDMAMMWPIFEECDPAAAPKRSTKKKSAKEFVPQQLQLSKKSTKKAHSNAHDGGVTLTMIKTEEAAEPPQAHEKASNNRDSTHRDSQPLPARDSPPDTRISQSRTHRQDSYEAELNPFGNDDIDLDSDADPSDHGDNPFDDDDYLADDGRPGVPVRALYDYEGGEEDELTFKAGDEFDKLEDEDEQGWCKGRLNGRVGLYPANYCAEI